MEDYGESFMINIAGAVQDADLEFIAEDGAATLTRSALVDSQKCEFGHENFANRSFYNKLTEARGKLPLKRFMEQHGRGPANGNWRNFPKCPICQNETCAGVFTGDRGVDLFKCHH